MFERGSYRQFRKLCLLFGGTRCPETPVPKDISVSMASIKPSMKAP
jgi:hypothetical protein